MMARFIRVSAAEAERWGLDLLDRDAPQLEFITPPQPPVPPILVAVAAAPERPCYRAGPFTRTEARNAFARFQREDIPIWARPFLVGALVEGKLELYIDNISGHVTVWLALQKMGATKAVLPDRTVWLTGNTLLKWSSKPEEGELVRRLLLTGAAANGADEAQRKIVDGQP